MQRPAMLLLVAVFTIHGTTAVFFASAQDEPKKVEPKVVEPKKVEPKKKAAETATAKKFCAAEHRDLKEAIRKYFLTVKDDAGFGTTALRIANGIDAFLKAEDEAGLSADASHHN